jgi:hypothetical protein
MSHPFFDCSTFPWDRRDARGLHRALFKAVEDRNDIGLLYKASGASLPPLPTGNAKAIWAAALDALATAARLKQFCHIVLEDESLSSIHETVRAVIDARLTEPATTGAPVAQVAPALAPSKTVAPLTKEMEHQVYESLVRLRKKLPERLERTFSPERLVRRVHVLPPHAYQTTDETLRNVSTINCSHIAHFITSDAPADFDQLSVTALVGFPDFAERPPFRIKPTDYDEIEPGKLFHVKFSFGKHVVPPNGRVTIQWECRIPGSVRRSKDYWVFPFLFERAVPEMRLEAAFRQNPLEVHVYRDGCNSQDGQPELEPLDVPDVVKEPGGQRANSYVYRLDVQQNAATYLFTWHLKSRMRS